MLFISRYKLFLKMKNYSNIRFCINTLRLNMFLIYKKYTQLYDDYIHIT